MIDHEGWQRHELLPKDWMFKVLWEGELKNKEWSQNLRYLSREGVPLESMKGVTDYMASSKGYTDKDMEKCREFAKLQSCPEKKYTWFDGGSSLPQGWKKRTSEGDSQFEWILSPEGRMFRSRYVAIQDMIKRNCGDDEVEEMREKLVGEENWQRSEF